MTFVAVAAGVGVATAATGAYTAYSANKQSKKARSAEEKRIKALQRETDIGRRSLSDLYGERGELDIDIGATFDEYVRKYPGLLDEIMPQLTDSSINAANRTGQNNVNQFLSYRDQIAPGSSRLSGQVFDQIQGLNPENLGQEEILAITRKLAPLIQSGTVDTSTGAVAGATTSPVSLYRNLISSEFSDRRNQFISQGNAFIGASGNAASRQQVSAADFLNSNLDRAFNVSSGLTSAEVNKDIFNLELAQSDIRAQEQYLALAAQGLNPQYDASGYNAAIASGVSTAGKGLTSAANALATKNANKNTSATIA